MFVAGGSFSLNRGRHSLGCCHIRPYFSVRSLGPCLTRLPRLVLVVRCPTLHVVEGLQAIAARLRLLLSTVLPFRYITARIRARLGRLSAPYAGRSLLNLA